MQLEIYQWLGPLLSIYYIIRTVKQYSLGKYSPRNTVIWIIFWIGIALLCIMPDEIPNALAKGLGFRDHINAIIFVALALLFLMIFYLSAALNRVENQLTDLVRKLALSEAHQEILADHSAAKSILPIVKKELETTEEKTSLDKNESEEILSDIEELENIVSKLMPTNSDENLDSIPNAGKTPKSKPEE